MHPAPSDMDRLTARDLIASGNLDVLVPCAPCHSSRPFDPWKMGARMGDTPLKQLKFVCRTCGTRATRLDVWRRHVGTGVVVATIQLERPKSGYGAGRWIDP
jgi:hypothetical protein